MSAPNTNVDRQVARHRPSLMGIGLAGAAVAGVILVLVFWPGKVGAPDTATSDPAAVTAQQSARVHQSSTPRKDRKRRRLNHA